MKYVKFLGAVLLGMAIVVGFIWLVSSFGVEEVSIVPDAPVVTQAIAGGPRTPYLAFLEADDVTASTFYVLVDVSDRTNFPHIQTSAIILKQLYHSGVLSAATHWDMKFGIVGSTDVTSTHIEWFHIDHRVRNTQYHWDYTFPEHGLDLMMTSADLPFVATVSYTDTTHITSSTGINSPVTVAGSITTTPDIGDLILYVEEIDTGGSISHISVGVAYDTR